MSINTDIRNFVIESLKGFYERFPKESLYEISFLDLKNLITSEKLIPGAYYRITDYITTTNSTNDIQTASYTAVNAHQFDLVVIAISKNLLDCKAFALPNSNDAYYINAGADLTKWQIWYDINNDVEKYFWADATNGKGVIYRIIDEWGNDCPYDFKNIQFKRRLSNGELDNSSGTNTWVYTFNAYDEDNRTINDASLLNELEINDDNYCICKNNKIRLLLDDDFIFNNVFLNQYSVINGTSCNCINNTFGSNCINNTFGSNCINNTFGSDCSNNTFGSNCSNITFGNDCSNNTFGSYCINNTFGSNCTNITFGNSLTTNNAYRNIIIENGNKYIRLYNNSGSSGYLQNIYIAQGCSGTNSNYTEISTIERNLSYRTTVGRDSNGNIQTYNEDGIRFNISNPSDYQVLSYKESHDAWENISLSSVAYNGNYNDLSNKPTIPSVYNSTITLNTNGEYLNNFTLNASSNKTITIPDSTAWKLNFSSDSLYSVNNESSLNFDIGSHNLMVFDYENSYETFPLLNDGGGLNTTDMFDPFRGFFICSSEYVPKKIEGSKAWRQGEFVGEHYFESEYNEVLDNGPIYLITTLINNCSVNALYLSPVKITASNVLSIFLGWYNKNKYALELYPFHPIYYYNGSNFSCYTNKLENLLDADINSSTLSNSQILKYVESGSGNGKWKNAPYSIPYGVCTDNSSTDKTVSISGITTLEEGLLIRVKNSNVASASGVTLNLNGLGAKTIVYNVNGAWSNVTSQWSANTIYTFIFDKVNDWWTMIDRDYNSDITTVSNLRHNYNYRTLIAKLFSGVLAFSIDEYRIVPIHSVPNAAGTDANSGTAKTMTTESFNPFGEIYLYRDSTPVDVNSESVRNALFIQYGELIDGRYTFNVTSTTSSGYNFTPHKELYLVVDLQSDGMVKLATEGSYLLNPWSNSLPTTNNGHLYILLGYSYDKYRFEFYDYHPIYYHDGTQLRIYSGDNANWDATSGPGFILNKPTIPTLRTINHEVITGSSNGDINIHDGFYFPNAVQDYDGNWYGAVIIGDQVWLAENLRTTHYADGTPIPQGIIENGDNVPLYFAVPNMEPAIYGLYYTRKAVMNGENDSNTNPSGVKGISLGTSANGDDIWHIPSKSEYEQLKGYVEKQSRYNYGNVYSAKALSATSEWDDSNIEYTPGNNKNENNAAGLNLIAAGRVYNEFDYQGKAAYFWTTTGGYASGHQGESEYYRPFYCYTAYQNPNLSFDNTFERQGMSVRLLSDMTPLQFRDWYIRRYGSLQHHLNGGGGSLPTPSPSDVDKLLSVDSSGNYVLVSILNSENIPY